LFLKVKFLRKINSEIYIGRIISCGMFKKKCPSCAKKIEKKFNYCPYCGVSFKAGDDQASFGMLGRNDSNERVQEELKLPFGMDKIMNSLVKQLEGQLGNLDMGDGQGLPRGVKIRVARGPAQVGLARDSGFGIRDSEKKKVIDMPVVSDEENERRMGLPKVEGESKIKRLSDTIIYEIAAPGVKKKDDVVLTELATGLEIKAYSKDKCYVKFIPLKVEVVEFYVEKEKVVVEIKG